MTTIKDNQNVSNHTTSKPKHIHFSEIITIHTYESYIDPHLPSHTQRSADRARLSTLIEPILTEAHRQNIRTRNFQLQEPATTPTHHNSL